MKLSELVEHTGQWLGYSATSVGTYARFLREAHQISGGPKGGAAVDMTDKDKITLFVAVLGCGAARSCPKDLPKLLSLKSNKTWVPKDMEMPSFFSGADLKSTLFAMFRDVQNGSLDRWGEQVEQQMKAKLTGPVSVELTVTFEIDASHATIRLGATMPIDITKDATTNVHLDKVFGAARVTPLAGFSRKIHEVSFERLKGWGTCLTES
jgi:hypothetical protein